MIKHPRSVVTFSIQVRTSRKSWILPCRRICSVRVREKEALTQRGLYARLRTYAWYGAYDRGLLREGMKADVVVLNPDTVGPAMPELVLDLPSGARRLKQTAEGILHTIVNGEVLLTNNVHSGATPGLLLRG